MANSYLNSFVDKTALIVGGGNGIGRAVALLFAEHGAKVVVADVDMDAAQQTVFMACQHSATQGHLALEVDVTDVRSVLVMSSALQELGGIDYAVNCAGVEGERAPLLDASLEQFDTVFDTNTRGAFLCMREELLLLLQGSSSRVQLPSCLQGPSGVGVNEEELREMAVEFQPAIVNIASMAALAASPEFGAYAASKAALVSLTQTAAIEHAGKVRVNCICPATTYTPMYERFAQAWPDWQQRTNAQYAVGRIAHVDEVARAALWLCSRECTFMTGSVIRIDGGQGFHPPHHLGIAQQPNTNRQVVRPSSLLSPARLRSIGVAQQKVWRMGGPCYSLPSFRREIRCTGVHGQRLSTLRL